jgi:hypothetical protein
MDKNNSEVIYEAKGHVDTFGRTNIVLLFAALVLAACVTPMCVLILLGY